MRTAITVADLFALPNSVSRNFRSGCEDMRQRGRIVKMAEGAAGYGFIRPDGQHDGNDCFFQTSQWPMGMAPPAIGMHLAFEAENTPRGPRVTSILATAVAEGHR